MTTVDYSDIARSVFPLLLIRVFEDAGKEPMGPLPHPHLPFAATASLLISAKPLRKGKHYIKSIFHFK